jgi:hypothetical protein
MGLIWAPQPGPQHALIDCPVPEILFGGARGGGKSDGVLGKFAIKQERYGAGFNGVFFRKEMPQTDDLIERAREIYTPLGAGWHEQKKMFRFPKGGRLRFRPLENAQAAEKYQGQNLSDVAVEEAGNYAEPSPIDRLWGALRSKSGVPTQMILTANPGGPGQQWIKRRFIDAAPRGMTVLREVLPNGKEHRRVFIPSKVQDNRVLLANDPEYISRLYLVGSKALVQAWLDGNWDAVDGAFFDAWSERNVVRPFTVPTLWTRFRSFDWGSARPFSVGWWAVATDDHPVETGVIPRGALVRYREWYGSTGKPNEGLKLTAEQVAEGIKAKELTDKLAYGVADPSIFREDGGPSIGERMRRAGVQFRPADNSRVPGNGAMGGWDQMRARIAGDERGPQLFVFDTCRDFIRTVPVLQHDTHKPEDLDTDGEDHIADEARYACMSRPWTTKGAAPATKPPDLWRKREAVSWRA